MLTFLTRKCSYSHISILKKYNLKSHHRFQAFDHYIHAQNYTGIKNYADFATNPEALEKIQLNMTER